MPRPGLVLDVDRSTPPILFHHGEGFRLEKLPPGRYNVRCYAEPGGKQWWNAGPDTLAVVSGKVARKIVAARPRQ